MITPKKKEILGILRNNSRTKDADIAKQVNIPVSTVAQAIDSMETNIGLRYSSLIDFRQTGYNHRLAFIVKTDSDYFINKPNINNISRIGETEYYIDALFQSMKDIADFTEELEENHVKIIKEIHVIEELKVEGFEI